MSSKQHQEILIKIARSHRLKTGHKFGLRVLDTVKEAMEIDGVNGNTLWQDAIEKEMQNVYVAFHIRTDSQVPRGYKLIPHYIIFEIKMDFTRKARLLAGGHNTGPPAQLTYSSMVSHDSVWIGFLIAKEKYDIITGPEFGELEWGKIAVITWAPYRHGLYIQSRRPRCLDTPFYSPKWPKILRVYTCLRRRSTDNLTSWHRDSWAPHVQVPISSQRRWSSIKILRSNYWALR